MAPDRKKPETASDINSSYRGRFAPSPTGPLHFGSLIAAVASYLQARTAGGEWLLRIEDLDPPREIPGADDDIIRTLEAFGFEWDGPIEYQSRRHDLYRDALAALEQQQLAFRCQCTRKQLIASAEYGELGVIYPGTCRDIEVDPRQQHSIRLRVKDKPVTVRDRVFGDLTQNLQQSLGDFIIRRSDGLYAYQLAVVVDDAEQHITEVVRGYDLFDNTPRQIWLQQCLDLETPAYVHLPLAVHPDQSKLSKQTGAPAVESNRAVQSLVRTLEFLGQAVPGDLADASLDEFWQAATDLWSLERVPRQPKIEFLLADQ